MQFQFNCINFGKQLFYASFSFWFYQFFIISIKTFFSASVKWILMFFFVLCDWLNFHIFMNRKVNERIMPEHSRVSKIKKNPYFNIFTISFWAGFSKYLWNTNWLMLKHQKSVWKFWSFIFFSMKTNNCLQWSAWGFLF